MAEEKRCFVPNCECTNGVNFPTEEDLRQKWLEGLNLVDKKPGVDDFVCLGHFAAADLNSDYVLGKYGGYSSFVCVWCRWLFLFVIIVVLLLCIGNGKERRK